VATAHDTPDDEADGGGCRGDAEGEGADAEDERHAECGEDAAAEERLVEQLLVSIPRGGACGIACGAASLQIRRIDGSRLPIMIPPKTTLINNPGNIESTETVRAGIRLQPLVTCPRTCGPANKMRKPASTLVGM
jgi:hypothetical protein